MRISEPVGHTSRHPECTQCLHTSDIISQLNSPDGSGPSGGTMSGASSPSNHDTSAKPVVGLAPGRSMNATCRQVEAPRSPVLS